MQICKICIIFEMKKCDSLKYNDFFHNKNDMLLLKIKLYNFDLWNSCLSELFMN